MLWFDEKSISNVGTFQRRHHLQYCCLLCVVLYLPTSFLKYGPHQQHRWNHNPFSFCHDQALSIWQVAMYIIRDQKRGADWNYGEIWCFVPYTQTSPGLGGTSSCRGPTIVVVGIYFFRQISHNILKSSHGLCFWASDPLINRFY